MLISKQEKEKLRQKSDPLPVDKLKLTAYLIGSLQILSSRLQEHKVLLTGTPLQNTVEELFSLLHFLEPSQFPSESEFLKDFGDLKTEEQVRRLSDEVLPEGLPEVCLYHLSVVIFSDSGKLFVCSLLMM